MSTPPRSRKCFAPSACASASEMPVLSATETALPDGDLFRAAAIMGIFAHAYHYVESSAYERIPDSILSPWAELSRRLQRPAPHLSFIDLNIYNWRLIDPTTPDPMRMENLKLLIPIVGNEDERRFQCTPIEMVAKFTPLVNAVVRAQEAAQRDDAGALERELVLLAEGFSSLTFTSFMKVNPNQESPLHVDPGRVGENGGAASHAVSSGQRASLAPAGPPSRRLR